MVVDTLCSEEQTFGDSETLHFKTSLKIDSIKKC